MRAVVQRVSEASVEVDGVCIGRIEAGLMVLLGVGDGDDAPDLEWLVRKVIGLRIFEDASGKMNDSVQDCGGAILLISQFTLYGDCRKGRRPSFIKAMAPEPASGWVDRFEAAVRGFGVPIETGRFGADMKVALVNDGPVTLILDSKERG